MSRSNIAVACAQEAMRLKPPLKLLFRTADEDTSCGDVAVPKGTTVALAVRQVCPLNSAMFDRVPPHVSALHPEI